MHPVTMFASVSGRPGEKEIRRQMEMLHGAGVEEVMVYPDSGCEFAYLTDEWFGAVACYLRYAEAFGMRIWLYDEYDWPSGDAGGRVTANEAFRLKSICVRGEHRGEITTRSTHNANLFGEKFFPDLLNPDAVDRFIQLTHEAYYARFAPAFGKTIVGIFTDEPSIGYAAGPDRVPYYNGLEADYEAAHGRPFAEALAAEDPLLTRHCLALCAERFRTVYFGRLTAWCEAHGILLTGHLLSDHNPLYGTRDNGNLLRCLSALPLPGVDDLHTDFRQLMQMPLMSAAEYAAGEHGAMAELYGLGPCSLSWARRRCMLYLCGCFKIGHYFFAGLSIDERRNLILTDFLSDLGEDQPDIAGLRYLVKEAERAAALATRDFDADVFLRYPTDLSADSQREEPNQHWFYQILEELRVRQLQWKLLDREPLPPGAHEITFDRGYALRLDGVPMSASEIGDALAKPLCATDAAGNRVPGLFVRRFSDGLTVVLNGYAPAGDYRIDGKTVRLERYGVYCSDAPLPATEALAETPVDCTFAVEYANENFDRLLYLNDTTAATLACAQPTRVTFFVRSDVEEVTLNGAPLAAPHETDAVLTPGFSPLYKMADPVLLDDATLTVPVGADRRYLPAVFFSADAAAAPDEVDGVCRVNLTPRRRTVAVGENFSDFGEVSLVAMVTVPENARALRLSGSELYTEVSFDGALAGVCLWERYDVPVDPALRGKTVELRVTQRSTLAPLFGDVARHEAESKVLSWRGCPLPEETRFGVTGAAWLS